MITQVFGKKRSWPISGFYLIIHLRLLLKTTKVSL